MNYPVNLPTVKFMARQVFSPVVELDTGMLDIVKLFEQPDCFYNDQNYIDGVLVHCFEGFSKHLLSKIWSVFHNTHLSRTLYTDDRAAKNPVAFQLINKDLFAFYNLA